MKTLLPALTIALFLSVSCTKSNQKEETAAKKPANFSIAEAKDWFAKNPVDSDPAINLDFNPGQFLPRWTKAVEDEDENYYVVEVPIRFTKAPGFLLKDKLQNKTANKVASETRLLLLKNKHTREVTSALMHVVPFESKSLLKFTYSDPGKDFSGNIFFTDLRGTFINGWLYNDGKIIAKADNSISSAQNNRAALPENCDQVTTDRYERTCYFYDDFTVECTDWQFVGSVVKIYCPDNSTNGGYSSQSCNIAELQAMLDGFIAAGKSVAELISITTVGESSSNGEITRTKDYTWDFYKGNFLTASFTYFSLDRGVHVKKGESWYWKSFTHINVGRKGTVPFETTCSILSATPYISPSKTYADMTLQYTVNVKLKCMGNDITSADSDAAYKGFQVWQ